MGKRSTTSTKSGRAMNPADQARKEARRRELKKNKKQRQVVREAVIKAKDPKKIIEELERLDQMEYNIHEAPPLPEHILSERRKRLLGNFSRCLSLYDKEDKTQYSDMKKLLGGYHRKHDETRKYYDAVKRAQHVNIEEITLPNLPPEDDSAQPPEDNLAFRAQGPVVISAPRVLSWEALSDDLSELGGRRPPGPPCYPPPSFSDDSDEEGYVRKDEPHEGESEEEEDEEEEDADTADHRKQKDFAVGGSEKAVGIDADEDIPMQESQSDPAQSISEGISKEMPPPAVPPMRPAPFNPGLPNFRNVPPPALSGPRFAPPPPRPGIPALNRMMMMRPPPGFPMPGLGPIGPVRPSMIPNDVISQRPAMYNQPVLTPESKTTIAAKPQLRNTMAEVTRLIPTAVKVKREEQIKPKAKPAAPLGPNVELIPHRPAGSNQKPKGSTDQAYEDFMKEMQGFL